MATGADLGAVTAPLDPGMVVVTTAAGDERAGCLVGFHSQCSIDPARYAVWLSKANRTFGVARRAEHLAVHLLGRDDGDVAELFGGETGDDVDKFARCRWTPGVGGVPLLDRLGQRFVGRTHAVLDHGGDHVCFVLDVEAVQLDAAGVTPLRLREVRGFHPGHAASERPHP